MNYTFENIAGYEKEKEELMRLCEIFNNREKYEAKGAKMPKGIIFYGAAGTGKTLFAKVMASVCGLEVFKIDLGNVKDAAEICKLIRKTFVKAAKRKEPSMVFFDEVDKVLPNYNEGYVTDRSKTILTQLLTLIDGMDSAGNIVFVATCNYYSSLPETLTRPGRIDKKIGLGYPNYNSRIAILNTYAQQTSCHFEVSMEELAELAGGFSCAALETLVNECVLQSDANGCADRTLIQKILFEIKNEDIPRAKPAIDQSIRACRNIGSFVVAKTMNDGDYVLSLDFCTVCNNFFNGVIAYMDDDYESDSAEEEDDEEEYDEDDGEQYDVPSGSFFSQNDMLNAVTVRIGGYVAEEIILNKIYNNVSYDLSLIDDILFSMLKNGMFGLEFRYSSGREEAYLCYSDERQDKINQLIDETIEECYQKAKGIIVKNEELIRKLIPILVEREALAKKDCEPILQELGGVRK